MIFDRLSWTVAINGLWGSKRLTMLTTIVVSVSAILVIFLSSLIEGLRVQLVAETTGAIPHVVISPLEKRPVSPSELSTADVLVLGKRSTAVRQKEKIEDWRRLVKRVEGFDDSIVAVSPTVNGQGFVSVGEKREAVRISGVEPANYDRIVAIERNLIAGRFYRMAPGEVVIGQGLADSLGVTVNDRLRLNASTGAVADKRVTGVFSTGFGALDDGAVLMPIGDAQSLYGLGSAVNVIGIRVTDVFESERIAAGIQRQVTYDVRAWTQDNQRLLGALEAQRRSSDMITFFTAIAASFAIASILIVLVTNKLREIGILKAMGATRSQIQTIFALQGTLLSAFGGLVGCVLGIALVEGLSRIEVERAGSGRVEGLFPFSLTAELIIGTMVASVVIGFIAAMVPARQASRVDPIEVIRGG